MIGSALLAAAAVDAAFQDYGAPPPPPQPRLERPASKDSPKQTGKEEMAAVPPPPPGPRLKDIPNTTIKYFDVTGKNDKAINRSLAKQRPISPTTKQPALTSWSVGANFNKQTTADGQCKITNAKTTFQGIANMPRLLDEEGVPAAVLAQWRSYVDTLDAHQAGSLHFVHDRLPQVERAILASSCDGVQATAAAAIEQLKKDAAAFEQQRRGATTASKK